MSEGPSSPLRAAAVDQVVCPRGIGWALELAAAQQTLFLAECLLLHDHAGRIDSAIQTDALSLAGGTDPTICGEGAVKATKKDTRAHASSAGRVAVGGPAGGAPARLEGTTPHRRPAAPC